MRHPTFVLKEKDMEAIKNFLAKIPYDKVQSQRLVTNGEQQVNILSLQQGEEIPSHTSVKDAVVIVLEGKMIFSSGGTDYELQAMDMIAFGPADEHRVKALEDVKFLLVQ